MLARTDCLSQPGTAHVLRLAPWEMHRPPRTATLLQPSASHFFRAGPWALHRPAFLTFLLQPGTEHCFRLAPCVMHRPPCTTRLGQPSTVHLRRTRVLPLLLSPLDVRRWRAGLLVLRDATAVPPLGILRVVGEIWGLLLLLALAVVAGLRMAVRLDAAISMSSVSSAGLAGGGDVLSFFDAAAVLWAGGVVVARVVGEGLDADTGAAPGGGGMGCCMGVPAVLGVIAAAPGGVTMVGTG